MRFMRKSIYDRPMERLLEELDRKEPGSDDYNTLLGRVDQMSHLQERDRSRRVSPDTMWLVAGNIIGILVIVAYEQKHVMASRATNFILKTKT